MHKAPDKENDFTMGEKKNHWMRGGETGSGYNRTLAKPAAFLIPAWCWDWVERS